MKTGETEVTSGTGQEDARGTHSYNFAGAYFTYIWKKEYSLKNIE